MADSECRAEFRVNNRDLPHLAECLQIPDAFLCNQSSVCEGMEALCTLLRRLSYPCKYSDMIPRFGRPAPVLSMVTNKVIDFIWHPWTENHGMESRPSESSTSTNLCRCCVCKGCSPWKLFWICGRYCYANCTSGWKSKSCLQWTQKDTCPEISVSGAT